MFKEKFARGINHYDVNYFLVTQKTIPSEYHTSKSSEDYIQSAKKTNPPEGSYKKNNLSDKNCCFCIAV